MHTQQTKPSGKSRVGRRVGGTLWPPGLLIAAMTVVVVVAVVAYTTTTRSLHAAHASEDADWRTALREGRSVDFFRMGARGEQLAASVTAGRRLTVSERVEVGKRLANFAQKAQRTLDSYDRSKVTELEGALFAAQQQETIEVHKCGLAQLQGDNYWIVEAASPAPPPRDGELLLRLGSVAREGLQELDIVLPIDGMGSAELQAAIAALQSVELEIANQLAEAVNGLPIAERQPLIAALAKKWHSKRGGSEVQSQVANLGGATLQEVAMRSLQVSSDGLWLQAIRQ